MTGVHFLPDYKALHLITHLYGEPGRFYHGPEHLLECQRLWLAWQRGQKWKHAVEAAVALAYHDASTPGRVGAEASSAAIARTHFPGGVDFDLVDRMILATGRHTELHIEAPEDVLRVMDIDLAGLGRPWDEYDRNRLGVRLEYPTATDEEWAEGRSKFLAGMLKRPTIYRVEPPPGSGEVQARSNMLREHGELNE